MLIFTKFLGLPILILFAIVVGLAFWNLDLLEDAKRAPVAIKINDQVDAGRYS